MKTITFDGISATLVPKLLLPPPSQLRAAADVLLSQVDPSSLHHRIERAGRLLAAADEAEAMAKAGDPVDAQATAIVERMRSSAA